jgi:glycerol kinase
VAQLVVVVSGALVQWLRDQLGLFTRSADIEGLARSVPDSGGVTLVPAFAGLGAPHWDPGARGAILGLSRGTTRAHIARAALEAIALQNAELIELFGRESGIAIRSLLADGGAARNDLLMQLQADLGGVEVLRPAEVEATARGAAAIAALGAREWSDLGRAAVAQGGARFRPRIPDTERRARLDAWREAVERTRSR